MLGLDVLPDPELVRPLPRVLLPGTELSSAAATEAAFNIEFQDGADQQLF